MPTFTTDADNDVLDFVGVGFGPSNLALAIAVEEFSAQCPAGVAINAEFIEAKPEFGWHTGMLIPGATMQISFLKDLVTQRNPQSEFSFLSYLTERGRLSEFINYKTFFPTRLEFHDYLSWAAEGDGHGALRLAGGLGTARRRFLRGRHHRGPRRPAARPQRGDRGRAEPATVRRPPVGPSDPQPRFPQRPGAAPLSDARPVRRGRRRQSAAEVTAYLHDTFPCAEVHAVFAKYGYSPATTARSPTGSSTPAP
ncbi:hypothetical protein MANY_00020 [Mycolicibacterium anyangense]|uniref:L-lysine N6-monooxygenase MbtG n=1 Tax=Mycolicibacterium anyangense TaxID=1431246 RepID=A0A6N4W1Z4_9MYCO|nr:hypothetical protein MANY_00020 [Mycolicibacterium anyangense]